MATSATPASAEATCPKCGEAALPPDKMLRLLDKTLRRCSACGHLFNYPPAARKAKRK